MTTFAFGFNPVPRDTGFGVGDRGFEKGCAIPVDVAAGVPAVRGDAVVEEHWGRLVVKDREKGSDGEAEERRGRAERRQRVQIMVGVGGGVELGWRAVWKLFGGVREARGSLGATNIKLAIG
jgi:hypothetical protein